MKGSWYVTLVICLNIIKYSIRSLSINCLIDSIAYSILKYFFMIFYETDFKRLKVMGFLKWFLVETFYLDIFLSQWLCLRYQRPVWDSILLFGVYDALNLYIKFYISGKIF